MENLKINKVKLQKDERMRRSEEDERRGKKIKKKRKKETGELNLRLKDN